MKTDELADQEKYEEYQPPKKQGRKNKAEASKLSKESHMTRRRPQPETSEQEIRPQNIPQSSGNEPIVSEGFENEVTKVVIIIPYSQMQESNFEHFTNTSVLGAEIVFSIQKANEYITILAKLPLINKKMQVEEQQKMPEPLSSQSNSDAQEIISVFDIRGKYVYMAGYEPENRNIKGNRKQLNSFQFVEIVKFKVRNPFSDLFIYFHLKIEEYLSQDYVGLVNQGNTCYMNSYLQTLYHIPAFRNLVYEAEIQDENKFPATLQQLFYNLDNSQKAVSPEALVKSFGWGKHEASIQQDAQQFSCLFFQALEHKLNNSAPKAGYKNRTIDNLFKGSLNHYIRCKKVGTVIDNTDFRNENYEEFIDLQVTIAPTLSEALDLYTSEVHLEGDNAYYTEEFGKQQAFKGNFVLMKGVKLSYLPPVLMIQLKRFQYNFEENKNVKILSGLEYEQELDFGRWTTSGEKDIYELYAVLVHQGARAQSGHYFNYVNQGDQWYKFNDEFVQLVTRQRAFNFNFGGFHETIDFDAKQMKVTKKFLQSKTTAYMLVYIKQSLKDELMKDNEKLPGWIERKNTHKLEMEQDKKNKKNYFHKVGFIDWENNLQGSICSDSGFLNEIILENGKDTIQQIPKEANLEQWLTQQKMIDPKPDLGEQKKKKSKKAKSSDQEKQDPKQTGIYLFYATDRQILMGNKSANKVIDLLKVSPDPILFKAPLQAKKDEYLTVLKRYKVDKKDGKIQTSFFYDILITIKKETNYIDLMNIFASKFLNKAEVEGMGKNVHYGFYIDDQNGGPIKIQRESDPIPVQSPKFNQLLVCIVQEINFQMTEEQKKLYSFPKYYETRKNIISLTIAEEKGQTLLSKKDLSGNETLSHLRIIIFTNLTEEKKAQYVSPQNIVLKAKIKKGSKIYYQVFEPEWKSIKDITKIDDRIQFTFSAITVQSRLSKYMIEIQYRNINKEFSQSISLVVAKDQSGQNLTKIIKTYSAIVQMLQNDGIQENQAEIVLMTKKRTFINDIVSNEGKVPGKGDLDVVLKRQKNALVVVIQRTELKMETSPIIQMDEEQFDPVVNILLHHMSNSGQKIGAPLYIRVDRRMQLSELKAKILDLIKDQVFFWEGKFHTCAPEKLIIQLYGKDSKKVIELTDLATLQAIKRLKIQQKANIETKRKKSKDLKNTSRKQSLVEQAKEPPLEIVNQQEEPTINGQEIIDVDKEEQPILQKYDKTFSKQNNRQEIKQKNLEENFKEESEYKVQVLEISDDSMEKEEEQIKQDEEKGDEPIVDPQITKIEGPETLLGVFPRLKVLKIRVLHSYLTRPNYFMKIHVYD